MNPRLRLAAGAATAAVSASLLVSTPVVSPADAATRPTVKVTDRTPRVGQAVFAVTTQGRAVDDRVFVLQRRVGTTWIEIVRRYQGSKASVKVPVPTVPGTGVYRVATGTAAPTTAQPSAVDLTAVSKAFKVRVPSRPGTVLAAGVSDQDHHDMSSTGRYVVSGEPSEDDPFSTISVWDRVTGAEAFLEAGGYQTPVDISADGSTIAYEGFFDNAVNVTDRVTGTTVRSPGDHSNTPPDSDAVRDTRPSLDATGRFVAFSRLTLAAGGPTRNGVYLWDRSDNSVREIIGTDTTASAPTASGAYYEARISGDGNSIFISIEGGAPALVWSRATNAVTPLAAGLVHVGDSSADGRFVVAGTTNTGVALTADRRLLDRATGKVSTVKLTGAFRSWKVVTVTDITENGRYLTVTASRKGRSSVFRLDRVKRTTVRASLSYRGTALNRSAGYGITSESGRIVSFRSRATNATGEKNRFRSLQTLVRFTR